MAKNESASAADQEDSFSRAGVGQATTCTAESLAARAAAAGDKNPLTTDGERVPAPLQFRDPARYQVLAEHGRGGLGRVYRARDKELGRDVALKELLQPTYQAEGRFFREALITARLEHPGIVPVHEAGRWPDGTAFYAMKLVSGRPLSELIDEAKTLEARLALLPHIISVADAIAYAHDRNIIHRDLKPSNVIVGDFGETIVIDWGLAKELTEPIDEAGTDGPYRSPSVAALTMAGTILGTPAYMSPEQARGDVVDTRSDVYSLGAILYQLFSGVSPAKASQSRLRASLNGVHQDLVTIILKSLSAAAEDRYGDAGAFAADLRAYDAGARITAREYSLAALLAHWVRHHKRIGLAVAIPTIAAVVIGVVSLREIVLRGNREAAAKQEAFRERNRSAASARQAHERSNELLLHQADVLLTIDPTRAFSLAQSYPVDGGERQRADVVMADALNRGVATKTIDHRRLGRPQDLFWSADDALVTYSVRDHLSFLQSDGLERTPSIELSPFSRASMTECGDAISFQRRNGEVVVRQIRTSSDTTLGNIGPTTWDLQISPRGNYVAASSSNGTIHLWRVRDRAMSRMVRTPGVYQALRFSRAESELASCERDKTLTVWSTATNSRLLHARCDGLANIDFRFCGRHLLVGSRSHDVESYDIVPNHVRLAWRTPMDGPINFIRVVDDKEALIASADGNVARLRCDTGAVMWRAHLKANITQLLHSSVIRHTIAGHSDGAVSIIDPSGHVSSILRGDASAVVAVAVSPDGDRLAAASANGTFRIWSLRRPAIRSVALASAPLFHVRFSPDSELIATESQDGGVYVCTTSGLQCQQKMSHSSLAHGLAWAPDGTQLGSSGWDGHVRIWSRLFDRVSTVNIFSKETNVYLLGFQPGNTHALISAPSSGWAIWNIRASEVSDRVASLDETVAVSKDGSTIARISKEGVLSLSRVSAGKLRPMGSARLQRTATEEGRLELSATGRYGLYMPNESTVAFLDMTDPRNVQQYEWPLSAGAGRPLGLSFDPEEANAAVSYENGHVIRVSMERSAVFEYTPFEETPFFTLVGHDRMAAITARGMAWIFDLRGRGRHCVIHFDGDVIMGADLSANGAVIATVSKAGSLQALTVDECGWVESSVGDVRTSEFRRIATGGQNSPPSLR